MEEPRGANFFWLPLRRWAPESTFSGTSSVELAASTSVGLHVVVKLCQRGSYASLLTWQQSMPATRNL
ncbi:hypothetical protein GQ55_7G336400 [Panicum hallii var. hallii]|uniref:Uncharacterized protein n=1 Tax=Panicum hallii var. hallii TaxID=1504633 RepID=A0A2T7D1W3_9POAL|nr:hypothetical protein GQ55_7G336400 [Panicum hallii var. hallii]